ncbi:MAG: hypothetical protein HC938_04895 [Nitrospira sp.]|nr:hypothetical protein [Nitrospira sp.]
MMKTTSAGHISTKPKGNRVQLSTMISVSILCVAVSGVCGNSQLAHALDPIPAHILNGLQAGVVTSVEQQSINISGKMYTVDHEIQIRDQEDNVLQPEVVQIGHEVKFHLKKGESNKIDFMIVYMPQ